MNAVQKKVAFYGALVEILTDEEFVKSSAEAVVKLFGEVEETLSICGDVTVDYIENVYNAHNTDVSNWDSLNDLVEAAFKDLAKHLRIPKVRAIIDGFIKMVDGDSEDLYACTTNVRCLSDDPNGPAVVTLVVHNYGRFKDFLEKTDSITNLRHSDQTE